MALLAEGRTTKKASRPSWAPGVSAPAARRRARAPTARTTQARSPSTPWERYQAGRGGPMVPSARRRSDPHSATSRGERGIGTAHRGRAERGGPGGRGAPGGRADHRGEGRHQGGDEQRVAGRVGEGVVGSGGLQATPGQGGRDGGQRHGVAARGRSLAGDDDPDVAGRRHQDEHDPEGFSPGRRRENLAHHLGVRVTTCRLFTPLHRPCPISSP